MPEKVDYEFAWALDKPICGLAIRSSAPNGIEVTQGTAPGISVTLLATALSYCAHRLVYPEVTSPPKIEPFQPLHVHLPGDAINHALGRMKALKTGEAAVRQFPRLTISVNEASRLTSD